MDVNRVLLEYDSMFGKNTLEEIESYLVSCIEEAYEEPDYYSVITLLNEFIGFCRDTSQNEKGKEGCRYTIDIMNRMGLAGTVEYATSLLNVANAYRAYGMLNESLELYSKVEEIYNQNLSPNEFNYASLYNNWSLLYQEMDDFDSAEDMLKKALRIVDRYPNAVVEQATTRTNLAVTMFKISQDEKNGLHGAEREREADATYREAMSYLNHALKIYEKDGGKDFHYSAALAAMGDAVYMKADYIGATRYYGRAMAELEKHVGKTEAYDRIQEKYESAFRRAEMEMNASDSVFYDEEKTMREVNAREQNIEEKIMAEEKTNFSEAVENEESTESEKNTENEAWDEIDGEDEAEDAPEIKYYKNNMQRCRAFYREQGAPMIHRAFPQYEDRIAVGLVGEGSDCFGFDDEISMDHDYEVGFCMWLSDEDYDVISGRLQFEYENILTRYAKYYAMQNDNTEENGEKPLNRFIDGRRGVFRISEFYNRLIFAYSAVADTGKNVITDFSNISDYTWNIAGDEGLAAAVNGHIFRDDLGQFTKIREQLLNYYPRNIWLLKLAGELHNFSQYAQSNYERMMARADYPSAMICIAKASESAMRIAYILDKEYAPYYKWMRRGMNTLRKLKDLAIMLDNIAKLPCQIDAWENKKYNPYSINEDDAVAVSFEAVARRIQGELVAQGLITGKSTFLDNYCQMLVDNAVRGMASEQQETFTAERNENVLVDEATDELEIEKIVSEKMERRNTRMTKDELVEDIISREWKQFDKVKNEGGRAECQDDWNTFSLMRRSQYDAWTEELLESFRNDLISAEERGWNLITEKYARMMESTAPVRFEELRDSLPVRDASRIAIQEEIIKIQVEWMEEFARNFPKMAGNARSIHTSEDNVFDTSYETYLRGELGTYSDETLVLYGRFIVDTQRQGKNLAYIIMNNTAKGYGYESVTEAELRLTMAEGK